MFTVCVTFCKREQSGNLRFVHRSITDNITPLNKCSMLHAVKMLKPMDTSNLMSSVPSIYSLC